jgi:hypothetical protein
MKRLSVSLCGGLLIPVFLFATFLLLARVFGVTGIMDRVLTFLLYSVTLPLFFWESVFPRGCESCGPSVGAIAASIATDFIFYSSLTYLIQLILRRPRGGDAPSLSERRA